LSRKEIEEGPPTLEDFLSGVDFLDLWNNKLFLGQEFLTWLYLATELNGREMELPDGQVVEVFFENRLQLSLGQGNNKRSVSITTPEEPMEADWDEAYKAIENHKKVTKGTLRIKRGPDEWRLTLPHDTLSPQGIKSTASKEREQVADDLGAAGKFLERAALTSELLHILEDLFRLFLTVRLSTEWEAEELSRLKEHLSSRK
jgi:recombination associated protein RdgC